MIISHKHKYLFVGLPLTASSAISKELRENYDGSPILYKHATYYDYLRLARTESSENILPPDELFVFSCIRNPMSIAVSQYFKYKSDHNERYSKPKLRERDSFIKYLVDMRRYAFIRNTGADFPAYFKKFYKIPYNNWSCLSHKNFDFVIRFEHLQDDFATVLKLLGIEQKRPLPRRNKTSIKNKDFLSYYTPETVERAKRIFGPFMRQWGYDFPPEWGDYGYPLPHRMEFYVVDAIRQIYWKRIRSKQNFYGQFDRWLREYFAVR